MTDSTINNRFYCVQRCIERDKEGAATRKGVDAILSFDYMGSAEFEFGALPATFRLLRSLATGGQLTLGKTENLRTYQNKGLWFIIPSSWNKIEFEEKLLQPSQNKLRTKEFTAMDSWLRTGTPDHMKRHIESYRTRVTSWLAIVDKYQVDQNEGKLPAWWGVHEGTARKLWAELKTTIPYDGLKA